LITSYDELDAQLKVYLENGEANGPLSVDFTNTHIVTMRRIDAEFARTTSSVDYFVPDSQVLYLTIRLLGGRMEGRVYGPTFMRRCVISAPKPHTHYFLGGAEDCLEKLISFFKCEQPDLDLIGSRHGYFSQGDEAAIVDEINRLSPDFVWVGLGTPKQQEWIDRNLSKIHRGIVLAVGFAFDVNAGTKTDAPVWMQRFGLTWVFRLASEPRRLFWRYLKYNTAYAWYVFRDHLVGLSR
jgi:N-acetylglucosaminyldiphosphoundecaprenol N-acetyl-beta-D-mannosaminyltransferase